MPIGCKLEWCCSLLEGHNRCEHHMYLHTHELFCNSYMPRWTLKGGQLSKGIVKQINHTIQFCSLSPNEVINDNLGVCIASDQGNVNA